MLIIDRALKLIKDKYNKIIDFPIYCPYPVGSGNDLSRSLGWSNIEKLSDKVLKHISDVFFVSNEMKRFHKLDRWSIKYVTQNSIKNGLDTDNNFKLLVFTILYFTFS